MPGLRLWEQGRVQLRYRRRAVLLERARVKGDRTLLRLLHRTAGTLPGVRLCVGPRLAVHCMIRLPDDFLDEFLNEFLDECLHEFLQDLEFLQNIYMYCYAPLLRG